MFIFCHTKIKWASLLCIVSFSVTFYLFLYPLIYLFYSSSVYYSSSSCYFIVKNTKIKSLSLPNMVLFSPSPCSSYPFILLSPFWLTRSFPSTVSSPCFFCWTREIKWLSLPRNFFLLSLFLNLLVHSRIFCLTRPLLSPVSRSRCSFFVWHENEVASFVHYLSFWVFFFCLARKWSESAFPITNILLFALPPSL